MLNQTSTRKTALAWLAVIAMLTVLLPVGLFSVSAGSPTPLGFTTLGLGLGQGFIQTPAGQEDIGTQLQWIPVDNVGSYSYTDTEYNTVYPYLFFKNNYNVDWSIKWYATPFYITITSLKIGSTVLYDGSAALPVAGVPYLDYPGATAVPETSTDTSEFISGVGHCWAIDTSFNSNLYRPTSGVDMAEVFSQNGYSFSSGDQITIDFMLTLTKPEPGATTAPTAEITTAPTDEITTAPTDEITTAPTDEITTAPTDEVTDGPTDGPTAIPHEHGDNCIKMGDATLDGWDKDLDIDDILAVRDDMFGLESLIGRALYAADITKTGVIDIDVILAIRSDMFGITETDIDCDYDADGGDEPTDAPSDEPTDEPSDAISPEPSDAISPEPTDEPTA